MKISLVCGLCWLLSLPAWAQGDGLTGEYFNSADFTGRVARMRIDKTIDFEWGFNSPLTGIQNDNFSVRWTGQLSAPVTGNYTFTTYSDDGVRVWINGEKIIDNWTVHDPVYNESQPINLIAGKKYSLKVEYFEKTTMATLRLFWTYPGQPRQLIPSGQFFTGNPIKIPKPAPGNGTGLRADFYPNIDLTGTPALHRIDAAIDFDWGRNRPVAGVGADSFSIRWTGQIQAPITGDIVFTTASDDGARLFVDHQLVINNWSERSKREQNSTPISMVAGRKYDLRLEYFEAAGNAAAQLRWRYAGQPAQIVPRQYFYPASQTYSPSTWPLLELSNENNAAARFLLQASYGPTMREIADVRHQGYARWINEQFALPVHSHQEFLNKLRDAGENIFNQHARESFWTQALTGHDQLRQRVTFALSQIFVVSELGGMLDSQPYALASYLDTLNKNAFGNFRQLLEDVTLHPAMGRYLDLMASDKEDLATGRTPNENYAREILQLFSIGLYQLQQDGTLKLDAKRNPIPTYGQDEVKGFAKVFTGWNWGGNAIRDDRTWPNPPVQYYWDLPMQSWPSRHSAGEKQLLNGVKIPAGQTPEKDLQAALDNIFNHPNVGPFIGRQLVQRLVTSNPTSGYVRRVAAAFNDNGKGVRGDLKAVIKAILLDPEARKIPSENVTSKLREPVLRWAHLLRAFHAQPGGGRYRIWYVDSAENELGQSPLRAPSVFNFFEPDYVMPGAIANAGIASPEFKLTNETAVIGNANFLFGMLYGGYGGWLGYPVTFDFSGFVGWANDPAKLINQLNLLLMAGAMSKPMQGTLIKAVSDINPNLPGERLRAAIYLIATSKEFVVQK
ncbi:MAG: DUF1800 family protein [Acidobacteria bacterium]|nr:DUF1800 family protein [Acidobacteriota bacterium]